MRKFNIFGRAENYDVMNGELIDPFLDYVVTKSDLMRLPSERSGGSSQACRKWSASFRLYDRMSRILSKPLPFLLEGGR